MEAAAEAAEQRQHDPGHAGTGCTLPPAGPAALLPHPPAHLAVGHAGRAGPSLDRAPAGRRGYRVLCSAAAGPPAAAGQHTITWPSTRAPLTLLIDSSSPQEPILAFLLATLPSLKSCLTASQCCARLWAPMFCQPCGEENIMGGKCRAGVYQVGLPGGGGGGWPGARWRGGPCTHPC